MPDLWEPTAADRDAYTRGVHAARATTEFPGSQAGLVLAGLREAFASLRARVGEPATPAASGWVYRETLDLEDVNALAAKGWRLHSRHRPDSPGDVPVYVLERPVGPQTVSADG